MFRNREDEKQTAKQTDKEWPVEGARQAQEGVSLEPREGSVSERRE